MSAPVRMRSDDPLSGEMDAAGPGESESLLLRQSRLGGQVTVSGAKNSVLRLMAASLLTGGTVTLHNYPATLLDAQVQLGMLEALGKKGTLVDGSLQISEPNGLVSDLQWPDRSIRNTLLVLGALVARTGEARVPLPGGCQLGDRKYDLHELVLGSLGAEVREEHGHLLAYAPRGLTGAEIVLPLRSTGATENALLAGSLARGRTVLRNPHIRPEILDLADFLRSMGATITVHGQEKIVIDGVEALDGTSRHVMPDNMEALTWLIGAVITGGEIEILDFPARHLEVPLIFLRESGAVMTIEDHRAVVHRSTPYPLEISTGPYPGINSDMQPLFAAMGACANGETRVVDLRFSDRYGYLGEFRKFGIESRVEQGTAKITGCADLVGCDVRALDLRTGAALAMLGLVARGETRIHDAWQIERGYDRFVEKLTLLGASAQAHSA